MNPLEQLRDIHLPEPVTAWPPAYGWWILTALCLLSVILLAIWLGKRHLTGLAKRQALKQLQQINQSDADWPQQLNQLLKRAAMSYFPATQVANLFGDAWCEFLSNSLPAKKQSEFTAQFQKLNQQLYSANANELSFEQSHALCQNWLKLALPPSSKTLLTASQGVR